MSTALWMNIPLMVLAFGLMVGIPLWLLRRPDWHGKQEVQLVPAYIVRQRPEVVQWQRASRATRPVRPATGGANW